MKQMIENLINGNLTDARKRSKQFSMGRIAKYCIVHLEWSESRAWCAAHFLKTGLGWQDYCDAE
jgi:hypothetical protein